MKPSSLKNLRVLLTVGPTQEPIDPVRYLSNHSSGEMGLTLAQTLKEAGSRVTVVAGPVSKTIPQGVKVISVRTAQEMLRAVKKNWQRTDAFFATAAVSDWRPKHVLRQKMKKGKDHIRKITLVANPDILAQAGQWKGKKHKPILVGFSLATKSVSKRAKEKLKKKNLDLIIGNTPASFGSSHIRPIWIEKNRPPIAFGAMTKKSLSKKITRWLAGQL